MKDRIRLMRKYDCRDENGQRLYTVSELAAEAGVSRQCLHMWINRWQESGETGMVELSRAPHRITRVDPELVGQLLALKREFPDRGPEKLVTMMSDRTGAKPMAVSSAGKILAAYGMIRPRKIKQRVGPPSAAPVLPIPTAGHTLTADHKGYFRLGNGSYCYPLTIADPISRYLFAIDAQKAATVEAAWKVFERIFCDYGLPDQILTDNGIPFCSARSLGGLTELSKRWIKLGIHVARIDPGRPQQNGRHERMHRTLKAAAIRPPQRTLTAQRKHFDAFRYDYNWLRPHKALALQPPAAALRPFRRSFTGKIPIELAYPQHFQLRRVRHNGELKLGNHKLFLTEVLVGEIVGLNQTDEHLYEVYFGSCLLGFADTLSGTITKNEPPIRG